MSRRVLFNQVIIRLSRLFWNSSNRNVFHYTAMCGDPHFLRVIMNGMPNKRDFPSVALYTLSHLVLVDG